MIRCTIGNNLSRRAMMFDENVTLRSAFDEAGIDYSAGIPSLDGSILKPGDLDKTFSDFGITEKCFLNTIVKADNAAKINISAGAMALISSMTMTDIKKVEKYRPNALRLFDENGDETFRVATGSCGSVNKFGVTFAESTHDENKNACVTVMIPSDVNNAKEFAAEYFGAAFISLRLIESGIGSVLEEIKDEISSINDAIAII